MTDDRDPRLLQLFAAKQRPLDGESFVADMVARIEIEEKRHARLRYAVIAIVLVASALSTTWLMNELMQLARALPVEWQLGLPTNVEPQVLTTSMFILATAVVAFAWRSVARTR